MRSPLSLALVLLALGACGGGGQPDAAVPAADARLAVDAPVPDAPLPDAALADAPPPDAPPPIDAPPIDAPPPVDAPPIDAGETPDGAPPDAAPGVAYLMSPSATSAFAGTSISVMVQLVDLFNVPVHEAGRVVTFTASNDGIFTPAMVTTDGNGQAVSTFTLSKVAHQGHEIAVHDDQGAASYSATSIVGLLGPPSLSRSELTVFASSLPANGTAWSDVRVRLYDAAGNYIVEDVGAVTLKATLGTVSALAKNGGEYLGKFTAGDTPGTAFINAYLDGVALTTTASVTLTGVTSEQHYVVTFSKEDPIAGEQITVTAQLTDSGNSPVPTAGRQVTWDAGGTGGTFASAKSTTSGSGAATVGFTCSTLAPKVHDVGATDGSGVTGRRTVVVVPGPASLSASTVAAMDTSVIAGSGSTVIVVTLRDGYGNHATSGAAVTMATTFGVLGAIQPMGGGVTWAALGSDTIGDATVTAKLGSGALTHSAHVAFVVGGPARYLVTSSDDTPQVGDDVTITAQLVDAQDRPVMTAGKTVTWSKNGDGSFSSPTSTTGAGGAATVTFTVDTVPKPQTVTATTQADDLTGAVTFTSHTGPITMIVKLSADNQNAAAGGLVPDPPEVKALDGFGNGVIGTLSFVCGGGGNMNGGPTQLSQQTTAGGFASLSSWQLGPAGAQTIEVSAGDVKVTFTATITP